MILGFILPPEPVTRKGAEMLWVQLVNGQNPGLESSDLAPESFLDYFLFSDVFIHII